MREASSRKILKLKVTLRHISPPIWRRLLVSEAATLEDLHAIIQAAFGWLDYHLHVFEIGGVSYGDPRDDEESEQDLLDESEAKLRDLGLRKGQSFLYRYDFGDDWEHTVLVEEALPRERGTKVPRCIGGARSAPPEDVGGIGGYARFLDAISDPEDEGHAEYLEWAGGFFDPESFDLEAADKSIRMRRRLQRGGERSAFADDAWADPSEPHPLPAPAEPLGWEHAPTCTALPLRRDVVALLEYLRDNKVSGTQSTGNFSRKDVEGIAARFADPPPLEERIGDSVYRFRSEEDVWPLYLVHALASGARLIDGGPGRRWRLTPAGGQFLSSSAVEQAWALFAAWWYQINWLVADPFAPADDELPEEFCRWVLEQLRAARVGKSVELASFSEEAVKALGWRRSSDIERVTWDRLVSMVKWTVVEQLEKLGVLAGERTVVESSWGESEELVSFRVTPLGRAFLNSLV